MRLPVFTRLMVTGLPSDPRLPDSVAAERFLAQVDDERLTTAYRYWDGLRGERFAPSYAEVDPVEIPQLLRHLLVIEIETNATSRRYRYRLCGTEVEQHFGGPMRGRYIDTLMQGRYLTYIENLYDRLVERRSPIYSVSTYDQRAFHTKRLMLPLSSDARVVDMVLAAQVFYQSTGAPQTVLAVQADFVPRFEQIDGETTS